MCCPEMGKSIQPPSVDPRFDNLEKCCGDDLEDERLSGNQRPCYERVNQLILVEELVQPLRKEVQHKEEIRDNQCRKNRELDYESLERRFTLFLLRLSFFPYKLNRKSLQGVPTRLSHRSFFRALA